MNELPPGRYRHFKGKEYTVLGVARHSETQQELVGTEQQNRAICEREGGAT